MDVEELHDVSIDQGDHDVLFPNCDGNHRLDIHVEYKPSHYRARLLWYKNGRFNGIAEWATCEASDA